MEMIEKPPLDVLKDLYTRNAIVTDVRRGGLVLGASHYDGGIPMISIVSINGVDTLWCVGEMEGMEFIMNPKATEKYHDTLNEINSFEEDTSIEDANRVADHTYTVYEIEKGGAILVDPAQMIINKNASLYYLHQLDVLNQHLLHEVPETISPVGYKDLIDRINNFFNA